MTPVTVHDGRTPYHSDIGARHAPSADTACSSSGAATSRTKTGYCWGYYLQRPDSSAMAYVHELEVAERHWRRRIGRGLMLAFLGAAQPRGATKVSLTTGSGNVAALSLYDTIGGQIADQGDTTNYWWNLERSPQGVTRH